MGHPFHDALEGIGLLLADGIDYVRPAAARCVLAAANLLGDIGLELIALSWRLCDVGDRVAPARRPVPKAARPAPIDPRINAIGGKA